MVGGAVTMFATNGTKGIATNGAIGRYEWGAPGITTRNKVRYYVSQTDYTLTH